MAFLSFAVAPPECGIIVCAWDMIANRDVCGQASPGLSHVYLRQRQTVPQPRKLKNSVSYLF